MEIHEKLLLECEKCVDRGEIEKVMKARYGNSVKLKPVTKLTELELKTAKMMYKQMRKKYEQVFQDLSAMAHDLRQLGQFLGVYEKEE